MINIEELEYWMLLKFMIV